jgi:hypothetical protein
MGDVVYLKSTANLSTGGTCGCNRYAASENIFFERISRNWIGCLWCGYYGREFNAALKDNGGVLEVNAAF